MISQLNRYGYVWIRRRRNENHLFSLLYIFWEMYKDYLNAILDSQTHNQFDDKYRNGAMKNGF